MRQPRPEVAMKVAEELEIMLRLAAGQQVAGGPAVRGCDIDTDPFAFVGGVNDEEWGVGGHRRADRCAERR